MTAVMTGSDWTTKRMSENPTIRRPRPRESTSPAGAAMTTATTTVARVTRRLLPIQEATLVWVKTVM